MYLMAIDPKPVNYVGYLATVAVISQTHHCVVGIQQLQLRDVDLCHPEVIHHDHSLAATSQPTVDADHEILLSRLPDVLLQLCFVHYKSVLVPILKVTRQSILGSDSMTQSD